MGEMVNVGSPRINRIIRSEQVTEKDNMGYYLLEFKEKRLDEPNQVNNSRNISLAFSNCFSLKIFIIAVFTTVSDVP
jgi:hypothetical protein